MVQYFQAVIQMRGKRNRNCVVFAAQLYYQVSLGSIYHKLHYSIHSVRKTNCQLYTANQLQYL